MAFGGNVTVGLQIGGLQAFLSGWQSAAVVVARSVQAMAGSIRDLVVQTAQVGDNFDEMATRIGWTVEQVTSMRQAVDISGASFGELEVAVRQMNKAQDEALNGNKALAKSFAALGLSRSALETMGSKELFDAVAEGLAKVEKSSERTNLAMDLLGRSGTQMLPLITSNMGALAQESERLGVVWSTKEAKAAALFADEMNRAGNAIKGLSEEIGKQFMPYVQRAFSLVANVVPVLRAWLHENNFVAQSIGWIGMGIRGMIQWIVRIPRHVAEVVETVLRYIRRDLMPTLRQMLDPGGFAGVGVNAMLKAQGLDPDAVRKSLDDTDRALMEGMRRLKDTANMSEVIEPFAENSIIGRLRQLKDAAYEMSKPLVIPDAAENKGGANDPARRLTELEDIMKGFSDRTKARITGMASAFSGAFVAMTKAGKSFADALGQSIKEAVGAQSIQEGTYHFLAGLAMMFAPGQHGQGAARMAKGLALMAFGATLGGGGASASGGGGETSAPGAAAGGEQSPGYEVQPPEDRRKIEMHIHGDLWDSRATWNRIGDMSREFMDYDIQIRREAVAA